MNKQDLFVKEYLKDLNATQAYIRAGYKFKSENVAAASAAKILRNPKIQEKIQKAMAEREKRTEITQDRVLREIANLAFTDRTGIVNLKKNRVIIRDFEELTPEQRACVAGVKETKHGIEVSFYNKEKALEMLGRHLGMFNDKVKIDGEMTVNNPLQGLTTDELKKLIQG
ncbi:terminase small subunit [Fusobacterium necrophorum]|uniref:Terminase n=1 Tax=Fusobacterium necrophorum BL TaxID=1441732 RepID=A0AB73BWY4_9FUSO|nr:terminase small subunit [Fusobacterium necrophorum]AYZ73423.1 terminase small subunit [Fusobacterium necrophorum]AZW08580.1 terminase small subunit [Fusobacterium necrophorum subsp. necrophorum]KDE63783.1 terminase [Fusobacterium necrophorum BL]SDB41329.1 phage terminase small subunit [Fusobacterium necrophorum]SQD09505.1 Terminase small subunit [Fusobacterium necrophorum subsp. necrophorum]